MNTHDYDGGVLYGCDICGLARDHEIHTGLGQDRTKELFLAAALEDEEEHPHCSTSGADL